MLKKISITAAVALSVSACATGGGEIQPVAEVTQTPAKTIEEGKVLGLEISSTATPSPLLEKAEKQLGRDLAAGLSPGTFSKVVKAEQPHDYKLAAVITDLDSKNPRLSALGELISDSAGVEAGQVVSALAVDVDLQDAAGDGETITKFSVKGGGQAAVGDTALKNLAIRQTSANIQVSIWCINHKNDDPAAAPRCKGF